MVTTEERVSRLEGTYRHVEQRLGSLQDGRNSGEQFLRAEVTSLRDEVRGLRSEINDLRWDMGSSETSLRHKIDGRFYESTRYANDLVLRMIVTASIAASVGVVVGCIIVWFISSS